MIINIFTKGPPLYKELIQIRVNLQAVSLREATGTPMTWQESVFQINHCFTNDVITGDHIVVHHSDTEIFVDWQSGCQLKHPKTFIHT